MNTCLTCANADLRDPTDKERDRSLKAMAKAGMACCTLSFCRATFYSFKHVCEDWAPAGQSVVDGRIKWMEKRDEAKHSA